MAEDVRVVRVMSRDRPHSMTREKFRFVQQIPEYARESLLRRDSEQPVRVFVILVRVSAHV